MRVVILSAVEDMVCDFENEKITQDYKEMTRSAVLASLLNFV
jgi:hypothetical protein